LSAIDRLVESIGGPGNRRRPLRVLAASGQLGYGIPERAFATGISRGPDVIGCDMGSVDPGPYYLGAGKMSTSPRVTRRDLRMVLTAARKLGVPLILGTAGTAGAQPHLEATLAMIREIAAQENLHFRLAVLRGDIQKGMVKQALRDGRLQPLGNIPQLTEADIDACTHLVGQMGTEAFVRALATGADVVIAGRSCDTAVFAAVPQILRYPPGLLMHMAKIIECTSICCTPGGRDAILGLLEDDAFVLESMNPERHATPMSVAAHSLYEQADPFTVSEPEGTLWVDEARYEALDEHRARVSGARWVPAGQLTVKLEGSVKEGERAVLIAGSCDPRFIAALDTIFPAVEKTVRTILPGEYRIHPRVYGINGVVAWPTAPQPMPREVLILVEIIATTADEAHSAAIVFKQYLLHHGFPGRISTGGNLAFPFTPPELMAGAAYRFAVYHLMRVDSLVPLFPVDVETV